MTEGDGELAGCAAGRVEVWGMRGGLSTQVHSGSPKTLELSAAISTVQSLLLLRGLAPSLRAASNGGEGMRNN